MLGPVAHGFADAGALGMPVPLLVAGSVGLALAAAVLARRRPGPAGARDETQTAGGAGPLVTPTRPTATGLRVLAGLLLLAVLVPAALGPADAASNPAPRLLFTVVWAGLVPLSLLAGPVWRAANPLRPLSRWLARAGGDPHERDTLRLPAGVGVWPAVVAAAALSCVEHASSQSGPVVAVSLAGYALVQVVAALWFGRHWYARGDVLEVYSTTLGRLAPVGRDADGRPRRRRVRQALAAWQAPAGLAAFAGVLVGANLYDALDVSGPPAGRLLLLLGVMTVAGGGLLVAARPSWLAAATVPLLAGHAAAHYLFPLLVDTQVAAILASDPLGRGWDLLGLAGTEPVAEPIPAAVGLTVELGLLVAGHALALVVAGDLASAHLGQRAAEPALFGFRAAVVASLVAGVVLRFG